MGQGSLSGGGGSNALLKRKGEYGVIQEKRKRRDSLSEGHMYAKALKQEKTCVLKCSYQYFFPETILYPTI